MNTFVIDIDNTILQAPYDSINRKYLYEEAIPFNGIIKKINKDYERGNTIILFTARGMRTFKEDVNQIEKYHRPILEKWLEEHGVKYHKLIFGKPWGENVYYIDDKNLSINSYLNFKGV